jgi:hypothetical protein
MALKLHICPLVETYQRLGCTKIAQKFMKIMQISIALTLAALAVILTSCATPPSRAFHNTDTTALVIDSLEGQTGQILQPAASAKMSNDQLLAEAAKLPQHQTAVVILENYSDEEIGDQFRDRGTPWVVSLRNLGYQHIIFLEGMGVANPEGLITIVRYD